MLKIDFFHFHITCLLLMFTPLLRWQIDNRLMVRGGNSVCVGHVRCDCRSLPFVGGVGIVGDIIR